MNTTATTDFLAAFYGEDGSLVCLERPSSPGQGLLHPVRTYEEGMALRSRWTGWRFDADAGMAFPCEIAHMEVLEVGVNTAW